MDESSSRQRSVQDEAAAYEFRNSLVPARNAAPKSNSCAPRARQGNQTLLRSAAPGAHKVMEKAPCSSRYSLPPAFGWPKGHFSHTVALAALAGVGQGQGVFVSKHSTATLKRGATPMKKSATTKAAAQTPAPVPPAANGERSHCRQRPAFDRAA